MGTLALSLTGFSTNVPGTYIEVRFAQGEVNGDTNAHKVLLIAPKTSAGSATPDTQVYAIGSENDAITYGGTGSPLHRMARRFLQVCKSAKLYAICPTESAGTQATGTITFVNTSTAAGTVTYTCVGETITVSFASGATINSIASALSAAINLQTHWPITASPSSGVVTVTARVKGTNGNAIRHRATITSNCTTTCTVNAGTLTTGATDETYTASLATILAERFHKIVPAVSVTATSDTRISALKDQVVAQALPTTGIRQEVICGSALTPANSVTFAAASSGPANSPRFQLANQENSEWEPMELAAYLAAVRYINEDGSAPWYNYDSYGTGVNDSWSVPAPYLRADYPTVDEQATMIAGGVSPIAVASNGRTYLVQSCTCSTDVRVRDTAKVTVADRFADDLAVRYATKWTRAGVQDDPVNDNDQPPATVVTPDRLKGLTIAPLYIEYAKNGWLDSAKTLTATTGDIDACATGIDPVVTTRINARCPLHVLPLCHQFAALITENSAG